MTSVLVLHYSAFGHVAALSQAMAEGVRSTGANATVRRVPDLPGDRPSGDPAPVAEPEDLPRHDAVVFGTPTRFGAMAAPMKHFLDRCGALWGADALVGRVGGAFTSSDSQHGGQEHTLLSLHASLLHLGFVIAGLPYTFKGQTRMDEITGGSPYGATTLASGGDGTARLPSANELAGARHQGAHVATLARALAVLRAPGTPEAA